MSELYPSDPALRQRLNSFALSPTLNSLVGWVMPRGGIVFTETHEHRSALPKEWQDRYTELLHAAERAIEDQLEEEYRLYPDEHPAYHRFDADSDADDALLRQLAEEGYMRFGIWRTGGDVRMEVTATPALVKRHDLAVRELVSEALVEAVYLDEITQYGTRRKRLRGY
jgi:hypothetical protein